ncbi:MAG: hypothetical protein AAGE52_13630 [Myxococcota bacterium]
MARVLRLSWEPGPQWPETMRSEMPMPPETMTPLETMPPETTRPTMAQVRRGPLRLSAPLARLQPQTMPERPRCSPTAR